MNNSMNDLMNLISVLCGGYCLYTWFRLVREKRLFENGILLPKDRKPEDCVDEDAYIRIIRPKLGILGLVIFLFGVFSAINDRCDPPLLEFPLIFIPWGVEAAVLIWYAVSCFFKAVYSSWQSAFISASRPPASSISRSSSASFFALQKLR